MTASFLTSSQTMPDKVRNECRRDSNNHKDLKSAQTENNTQLTSPQSTVFTSRKDVTEDVQSLKINSNFSETTLVRPNKNRKCIAFVFSPLFSDTPKYNPVQSIAHQSPD